MDSKNETVAESSEPAPTQLLAVALKQLKAEGGLVWWDELCEQIYPDLDPGGRIRQFAEHHERWHMPLDVLIPTLQVLIRLANEFHSVKRTHEFLVAFHEAKTQEGWTEHPTEPSHAEYQALERLGKLLKRNGGDLTSRESRVLAERFPADRGPRPTFAQLAATIGVSKERVRQIQKSALDKLRGALEADPVLQ